MSRPIELNNFMTTKQFEQTKPNTEKMSKAIRAADSYKFRLSDELKVLAETELRETCATRDFALKALRDWIESNPRILAARIGKFDLEKKRSIDFKWQTQ